jgi:phenylpyruvate tautomerase PptA (4-oxalocrotonate tautomerase family)
MPVYRCTVPAGALDDDARKRIAGAITTVHCDVTDAPPTFVHVIYSETDASTYDVSGTIRAGRSDAVKRALVDGLRDAVAAIAGVEAADVTVSTEDIPASWVMEGGELLPERSRMVRPTRAPRRPPRPTAVGRHDQLARHARVGRRCPLTAPTSLCGS